GATTAPTSGATTAPTSGATTAPTSGATTVPTSGATTAPTATTAPQEGEVESISMTASAATIEVGQTAQLRVEFVPENAANKTVTFTSSDTTVATVDEKGTVTALKDGQTTIVATTANGKTATVTIKVAKVNPTKLELSSTSLDLTVGDTNVLAAVFTPADTTATGVTWISQDETVAQVDATGKVTAIGEGETIVTAKSVADENLVAQCTINVKKKTSEKTDGISISVANSLKDYENTVFTGNNADVKVRVYKDGKPVGNTDVTLKMEYKSGTGNYWYISNNQSNSSTVKTDDLGIASFTVSLHTGLKYDATDGVMGGYLLTATATGAQTTAQAPLTFARFTVGSASGRVATDDYSFSNVTVNRLLTDLVQGKNASEKSLAETQTVERRIIDYADKTNTNSELIGTSEYVVSQMVSTPGTTDHAVTFNAAPLIQYPEVITGTTDDDYKKAVNYVSDGYSVYDTTKSTIITEVPTNLNYATLNFKNVTISANTALKIEVYDAYDEIAGTYGSVLAKYAIKGEHVEDNFTFQIPIQELAKIADDYVYIKVYVQSEGQVEVAKAIGFDLVNITGNYIGTSKYKNVSEIYKDASIEWKQVQKGEIGQDAYEYAAYQSKVTMTADEAEKYGIKTKNQGDTYYNAKVEYRVPSYPHIGNAYVTVTLPNQNEDPIYFMIPTETVNNENKLMAPSNKVQAFRITTEEANKYGESATVTSDTSTVTINAEESGVTEVYGFLTVKDLDLTLEERRLFAYVEWAALPTEELKDITDFYALVGQTISVDVVVTDAKGNTQSNQEVEFYLGDDKSEKLTREDLPYGVTITSDSTKFDEAKSTITTDIDGKAHITFKSDSYKNGIFAEPLFAKCEGYTVKMSVAGTEAEYARLYWIAPGLSFTDQTEVGEDEVKGSEGYKEGQKATTTISYELSNTDAIQTETQNKKIDTTWLVGYKVVGLVEDGSAFASAQAAAEAGYSNVIISGAETEITLNGSGANDVLGSIVGEVDKKNAKITVTSVKTGTDVIKGSISRDTIDEETVMNFTLLDEAGLVIKTVRNVGKGETSASAGLNIPVKWIPVDMDYEIVTPSGYEFAVDDELLKKKTDTVYVRVFDSKDNMLDDYEVVYSVKCTEPGKAPVDIVPETKGISKNGLVAITYDIPDKTCTYDITATIEGNTTRNKSINYKLRPETTADFGMKTAKLNEATKQITVKLSDTVNASTVVKEMFTVVDNTKKPYTVTDVTASGDTLVLTLAEAINSNASYFNVTYNYVKENIDRKQMARRMVSHSQTAVSMVDGFTVTAYYSREPEIAYDNGVVSADNANMTLPDGAFVIFTYGDDDNKLYHVEAVEVKNGEAVCEAAKKAKSVVAYLGTSATNLSTSQTVNAPAEVEEEVITDETVAAEAPAEVTEENETDEVIAEEVAIEDAAMEDAE
ncbi:MAG: Ig-like domain-containing protein, partial [Lachnospiraceae bacterium]|nr:Ig-like domain-containing protein [Lachnospiraceae bacterium]